MKVLHDSPSVSPAHSGPSAMIRIMTRELANTVIEVDIATTDASGRGRLEISTCEPVTEGGVTYRYFRRQTSFYTFSWPLTRWLAHHIPEYDVVHIHALFSYAAIPEIGRAS